MSPSPEEIYIQCRVIKILSIWRGGWASCQQPLYEIKAFLILGFLAWNTPTAYAGDPRPSSHPPVGIDLWVWAKVAVWILVLLLVLLWVVSGLFSLTQRACIFLPVSVKLWVDYSLACKKDKSQTLPSSWLDSLTPTNVRVGLCLSIELHCMCKKDVIWIVPFPMCFKFQFPF